MEQLSEPPSHTGGSYQLSSAVLGEAAPAAWSVNLSSASKVELVS